MHKLLCLLLALSLSVATTAQEHSRNREFDRLFFEAAGELAQEHWEEARNKYEECLKLNEDVPAVWYELARLDLRDRDIVEAERKATRAVKLDSANPWYRRLLAEIYSGTGQYSKEIAIRKEITALLPQDPEPFYELAVAQLNAQELEEALETLEKIDRLVGVTEQVAQQRKLIYLALNRVDDAATALRGLVDANPTEPKHYLDLAGVYFANDRGPEGVSVLKELFQYYPSEPHAHLELAQYHQTRGEFDSAWVHLREAFKSPELAVDAKISVLLSFFALSESNPELLSRSYELLDLTILAAPEDPKTHAMKGDFLARDERLEEAVEAYRRAVNCPSPAPYEVWRQLILLEAELNAYDSLAVDARRVTELFPNQPFPYYLSGVAWIQVKKYREATEMLESGLAYVIGDQRLKEQFFTALAEAYHHLGEHESSDNYFDRALAIQPNNAGTLNNYAYYLSLRRERLADAQRMAEQCNTLVPDNPIFLDTWAWVLYERKDYKEALELLERSLQLGGGRQAEIVEHYGDVLYRLGRKEEARQQWDRARQMGAENPGLEEKIKSGKLP